MSLARESETYRAGDTAIDNSGHQLWFSKLPTCPDEKGNCMSVLKCRVCGHGDAESMGQIPDCAEFAGQQISPPIKGGELWICSDCGSMFRHPTLSASDYISLYEKLPSTVWVGSEEKRNDFSKIYAYLKNHIGGSILDVGCYTGDFLAGLSDSFEKFGVEPSDSASKSAAAKGITVLGTTLEDVDPNKVFDVVVAIDVIEHVLDVEIFLTRALASVRGNGLLIISSGNPGCFFWKKIFKSKFWYSNMAEHLTFPSYNYYVEFSRRSGMRDPEQKRFRYMKIKLVARILIIFRFLFIYTIYKILRTIRRITLNKTTAVVIRHVSLLGIFTDHHVIIFKKGMQCR